MAKYKLTDKQIEIELTDKEQPVTWEELLRFGLLIPVPEPEWPQLGDRYYRLSTISGSIFAYPWEDDAGDRISKSMKNCFRTEEEAKIYKKRALNNEI